jgi:ABC-type transport system involved in cytochrome c biogenesis permease subunit
MALDQRRALSNKLKALLSGAILLGLVIAGLSVKIFLPVLSAGTSNVVAAQKMQVPPYDYAAWHSLPVQENGRIKPFATACEEAVRHITGRARFEDKDPVTVVVMWMMRHGTSDSDADNWEKYHFILCPDHDLRRLIYEDLREPDEPLSEEQLHGKYVSPQELRRSKKYKALLDEADEIRESDREKADQLLTPDQRKAEEVAKRLVLFDSISQNQPPIYGAPQRRPMHSSPHQFVALDRVPGGAWFSIDELRDSRQDPDKWHSAMKDRLARAPQLYISPERQQALRQFQERVKAGTADKLLDELATELQQRVNEKIQAFEARHKGATATVTELGSDGIFSGLTSADLHGIHDLLKDPEKIPVASLSKRLREIFEERDHQVLADLRRRLPAMGAKYHPDDPQFRMLHLNYLETKYPDLYPHSAAWQKFPQREADLVLNSYDQLEKAYKAGSASEFDHASQNLFAALRQVSEEVGPYPGADTIRDRVSDLFSGSSINAPGEELLALETQFDRIQPFQWAWILMLASVLVFTASIALSSRICYVLGGLLYVASLSFQLFGFFTRVILSGRPPVSNMYETVIWVSFMSSIFALILELIYRRKVIILAGSLVATLGLVLADQLPLTLDPKISPLTPVLRSNYWLTIHVLTIVSSYAGGTLAWGLGNIALGMLAFGTPRRDQLKTLSQFTYRAIQIAVLLLAAGTFLGGWWAAESWGRFWGWDPKEVWALIALVCYVIPLHMRYIGWVKDFGLAVAAVICYAAIVMSWYGVNFVLGAGLHSYGFGGGGPWWVFWAGLINIEYVLICSALYLSKAKQMERTVASPSLQASGSLV